MIGIAIGDFIGSTYEPLMFNKGFRFKEPPMFNSFDDIPKGSKFTDDTYLAFAQIESILENKPLHICFKEWAARYPDAGYGRMFTKWLYSGKPTYRSFGNGAAVRATLLAQIYKDDEDDDEVLKHIKVTHDHPDVIKGVKLVTLFTRTYNVVIDEIKALEQNKAFGTHMYHTYLKPTYPFIQTDIDKLSKSGIPSAKAEPTVRNALVVTLQPDNPVDMISRALYLNEDPDTQAAIVGGIIDQTFHDPLLIRTEYEGSNLHWGDLEYYIRNHFDAKMNYWYEKFTKTYNLI